MPPGAISDSAAPHALRAGRRSNANQDEDRPHHIGFRKLHEIRKVSCTSDEKQAANSKESKGHGPFSKQNIISNSPRLDAERNGHVWKNFRHVEKCRQLRTA
jgi:hypothetical protein